MSGIDLKGLDHTSSISRRISQNAFLEPRREEIEANLKPLPTTQFIGG